MCFPFQGTVERIISGAHREGLVSKIQPRRNLRNLPHRALRTEAVQDFQSTESSSDDSLFISVPEESAAHNQLSPPLSPLYTEQDITTYFDSQIDFDQLSINLEQLSITPTDLNLTPSSNNQTLASSPTVPTPSTTMTTPMPVFGERAAPVFNSTRPNELGRYFDQLETLFARCGVTNDIDKKKYTVAYVDVDTADTWVYIPEYGDATKTYHDFKDVLSNLYRQTALKYIITDLDRLIGERQRIGVRTLLELTDFHLKFNAISTYLITADLLSKREQSQSYLRVFDPVLLNNIQMRLQIQHPAHHPSLPYSLQEIYDAAGWVLQGATPSSMVLPNVAPHSHAHPSHEQGFVKAEQLGTILTEFTKTIVDAIKQANTQPRSASMPMNRGGQVNSLACNFCGGEHFIRECDLVAEYVKEGKCRRNVEGKVVLPSGAYVPREIPGKNIRERCDEWHRRNPGQLASGTMFNAVVLPTPTNPNPQALTFSKSDDNSIVSTHQLSAADRIAALEAEIYSLKAKGQPRKFEGMRTRAQRARGETEEEKNEADEFDRSKVEPIRKPPTQKVQESTMDTSKQPSQVEGPVHPFRRAQDATYAPPQNRNIAAPMKSAPQPSKKADPAYRNIAPIHDTAIASKVYNRVLDTPLTVTTQELLSLSPEVRAQFREVTSLKRVAKEDQVEKPIEVKYGIEEVEDDWLSAEEMEYLYPDERPLMGKNVEAKSTEAFLVGPAPSKAIYTEDPIEQYYRTLRPGEKPDPEKLTVAAESCALRSIIPIIDNSFKVECILDPGCQIIAMSEEVCHELALPYDPSITLNMQSANGTIDQSLGLARNVPFHIAGITIYMQVHVLRNPAYDVLFGRPFDVLTESVVRNYRNEDQTITLHDPNTGKAVTIPTVTRGPPRILSKQCTHQSKKDFRR